MEPELVYMVNKSMFLEKAFVPENLVTMKKLCDGNMTRIQKPDRAVAAADAQQSNSSPSYKEKQQGKQQNVSQNYANLLVAMDKLQDVVERMRSRSKKEQSKLTNYIYNLIRRFGRKK